MATGTVKWFNAEKGFGFILQDSGGPDLFVHCTGITGSGYREMYEGQKVSFEVVQGHKGLQAENVTPACPPDSAPPPNRGVRGQARSVKLRVETPDGNGNRGAGGGISGRCLPRLWVPVAGSRRQGRTLRPPQAPWPFPGRLQMATRTPGSYAVTADGR